MDLRARVMSLLQEESELEEIVKLVGMDALSDIDRIKLEAARSIREDFLHQNAFHETDTYSTLNKQYHMMQLVMAYFDKSAEALKKGANLNALISMPVREKIGRFIKNNPAKNKKVYLWTFTTIPVIIFIVFNLILAVTAIEKIK
jgi:V/A-type H+-transporting ATPase subunit A